MLPKDWAEPNRSPRLYDLANDWATLRARYASLGPSPPLDRVFEVAETNKATHALVEGEYIDADYRDEFANFYASTFPPYPDRCERIHFLDDKVQRYLGYCVVRPVPRRPVCRTMLVPPDDRLDHISCVGPSVAEPYGQRYQAIGFPFIGQDFQFGVCAHASIWMIALYHHLVNRAPRYYLSDMVRAAGAYYSQDRLTPSGGLTLPQMAGVFGALRLPAIFYNIQSLPRGETAERIICRYLNSGLPVLLATQSEEEGHATTLIGYFHDPTGNLRFIRNDDARGPYLDCEPMGTPPEEWVALMVPLPGRIYLPGESAEKHAHLFFETELSSRSELSSLASRWVNGDLRVRSYVTTTGRYKSALAMRGLPPDVTTHHQLTSTSHWIWVCELQQRVLSKDGPNCVIGEVLLDATSDRLTPKLLSANLPGLMLRWPALGGKPTEQNGTQDLSFRYRSGSALSG